MNTSKWWAGLTVKGGDMIAAPYNHKEDLKAAIGQNLRFRETSMFGPEYDANMQGKPVVGPTVHERKWFAQVWLKDGIITKVT